MSGTGINWIVEPGSRPSSYDLGKRDDASLKQSFPASPLNTDTPSAGVGLGEKLINSNVIAQANRFLEGPVEGNDLFGGTVDLRYDHPDGPDELKPPSLRGVNQTAVDRSGNPIFVWAPNIATGDLNTGRQPETGVAAAVAITTGGKGAFTAPPGENDPRRTSEVIRTTLRIGSLRLGVGSIPRT